MAGDPPHGHHGDRGGAEQQSEDDARLAEVAGDRSPGGAGGVPGEHHTAGPQDPAGGVPREEPPVRHAGHPGQRRHQRPQHADPAAEEDRRAAAAAHVPFGPLPPLLTDPPAGPAALERRTGPAADLVADRVTGDGCESGHGEQHRQADPAARGEHTADQQRGLSGQHEADEGGGLSEGQQADGQVRDRTGHREHRVDQGGHRSRLALRARAGRSAAPGRPRGPRRPRRARARRGCRRRRRPGRPRAR